MIPKPATYTADLAALPKALQHLLPQRRWVLWRWKLRFNKKTKQMEWTKVPYRCDNPRKKARSNDPTTWAVYADAIAAIAADKAGKADIDGVGFMLKDSMIAAADLDHVRDLQTGELLGWAQRLCVEAEELGLYQEVTVSGTGLRFIGHVEENSAELHRKFTFDTASRTGIELYRNCGRFITISGVQQGGSSENLEPIGAYLDELLSRFDTPQPDPMYDFNTAGPQRDYYRDLIENGAAPGDDRSERFAEVVWHLAACGFTAEQIAEELAKYPNGIGAKYAGRLEAEVARSFAKGIARRGARYRCGSAGTGRARRPSHGAVEAGTGSTKLPTVPRFHDFGGRRGRAVRQNTGRDVSALRC
jgi:hypothetical protein